MLTPTVASMSDTLSHLPSIGLDHLNAVASLQQRCDRKYILSSQAADHFLAHLPENTAVLEIEGKLGFGYDSTYLDTGDLLCFGLAATRRRHRFKVRVRHYCDSDQWWLEVKTQGNRGLTVKDRLPLDGSLTTDPRDRLMNDSLVAGWLAATLAARGITPVATHRLLPTLEAAYRRSTVLLPDGSRVTVDTNLAWQSHDNQRSDQLDCLVIVETKTTGHACAADVWLWSHGARPARISKYATGMAWLTPKLADNRWHRTLTRLHTLQENNNDIV
jgi:hypothetical protein